MAQVTGTRVFSAQPYIRCATMKCVASIAGPVYDPTVQGAFGVEKAFTAEAFEQGWKAYGNTTGMSWFCPDHKPGSGHKLKRVTE